MKISVIMPIFNSGKTLERALLSVIHQKNEKIELVIIDGGSRDETLSIIEKYRNHIDYFVSEKDKGYADALNKGIKASNGEFVTMLAGDDCYLKNALTEVIPELNDEIDVWCGSIIEKRKYGYAVTYSEKDLNELYKCCSLRILASFIRKSVIEDVGGMPDSYKCAADRELFLRILEKGCRFKIDERPVILFSTEGMSESSDIGLREDMEISVNHGMNPDEAHRLFLKYRSELIGPKRKFKDSLFSLLAKMKLLDFCYRLTKKPKGYLRSSEFSIQE